MAPRKPPSPAMLSLCSKANALGRKRHGKNWEAVTPTKVERWLQNGLVPQPARPGRGQGPGRGVIYGKLQVDRVVELAELVRERRSLDASAVILFSRGREIDGERVRQGYLGCVARLERDVADAATRELGRHQARAGDKELTGQIWSATERAEWAEPALADRLREARGSGELRTRIRELGEPIGASLEGISHLVATAVLGQSPPEAELELLASVVGAVPTDARASTRFMNSDELRGLIEDASERDFIRTRDAWTRMRAAMETLVLAPELAEARRGMTVVTALGTPLGDAFDVLIPLTLERARGVDMELFADAFELAVGQLSKGRINE